MNFGGHIVMIDIFGEGIKLREINIELTEARIKVLDLHVILFLPAILHLCLVSSSLFTAKKLSKQANLWLSFLGLILINSQKDLRSSFLLKWFSWLLLLS